MDNVALQGISLHCAETCVEQIANLKASGHNEPLIQALADCATACIACARGCLVGTCLPETLKTCERACGNCIEACERHAAEQGVDLSNCQAACRECLEAVEA